MHQQILWRKVIQRQWLTLMPWLHFIIVPESLLVLID